MLRELDRREQRLAFAMLAQGEALDGVRSCRRSGCAGSACRVRLVIMTMCKACPTTAASVASISWRALAMRPHPYRWSRRGGTRGFLAIPVQGNRSGWADPDTRLAVAMTHNRMFRATTPEENPFVPIGEAVRKAFEVSGKAS